MKKALLFVTLMLTTLSALAKNLQTLVVTTTPQMHCESCENKIKNNLRFEKGIKQITTNIAEQTVTIVYDADKTTETKIIDSFKKFNYTANKISETKPQE